MTSKNLEMSLRSRRRERAHVLSNSAFRSLDARNEASDTMIRAIDRVPLEIWGHIIVFRASSYWKAPLVASAVCRAWRTAALLTTEAWTQLEIEDETRMSIQDLDLWLERAGNRPIHTLLERTKKRRMDSRIFLPRIAPRLVCMYLMGNLEALATNGVQFPVLELLTIFEPDTIRHQSLEFNRHRAPNLKSLHLHAIRSDQRSWSNLPPLQFIHIHITTFTIRNIWHRILSECRNSLQSVVLTSSVGLEPPSGPPIRMSKLLDIQILAPDQHTRASVVVVQSYLQMPGLCKLFDQFANCVVDPPQWDCPTLEEYILWYPSYAPDISQYTRLKRVVVVFWAEALEMVLMPCLMQLMAFGDDVLPSLTELRYAIEYRRTWEPDPNEWRNTMVSARRMITQIRKRRPQLRISTCRPVDILDLPHGLLQCFEGHPCCGL